MNILSIDIGLKNLAMVLFHWNGNPHTFPDMLSYHKVDLTNLPHKRVSRHRCKIPHTKEMADIVAHFIQEYHAYFHWADKVLVERQPPGGLLEIHSLLLFKYRSKTELVSPNSVHAHFSMNQLDYEGRKVKSLAIARHRHPGEIPETDERWHDVSDAILFAHWWCSRQKARHYDPLVAEAFEEFRLIRSPTCSNIPCIERMN
jgi:hypothetical protein